MISKVHLLSVRERTADCCRTTYDRYIDNTLGSKRLDEFRRSDINSFLTNCTAIRTKTKSRRKLSRDTLRLIYSTLRKMFAKAVDLEILTVNPAANHGTLFRSSGRVHENHPFETPEEAQTFLQNAEEYSPWYFALNATLLHTALRRTFFSVSAR